MCFPLKIKIVLSCNKQKLLVRLKGDGNYLSRTLGLLLKIAERMIGSKKKKSTV
jgi:hypothetical protein